MSLKALVISMVQMAYEALYIIPEILVHQNSKDIKRVINFALIRLLFSLIYE